MLKGFFFFNDGTVLGAHAPRAWFPLSRRGGGYGDTQRTDVHTSIPKVYNRKWTI